MKPRPTRETLAGARYLALRALARSTGRSTAELIQLYGLEGLLARLAASAWRDRMVLKGGVLLAALEARRPTRDIDLLALRTANDPQSVRELVAEIASISLDDGLEMVVIDAEAIREDDAYSGVRVTLRGQLASAQWSFHVDVNIGDPVWPAPGEVSLPRLLTNDPIVLLGYPLVMVLAEKLVTALHRGTANTRWRDFSDIYVLIRGHLVVGEDLQRATWEVAGFRKVPVRRLAEVLEGFAALGQTRWQIWHRKQGIGDQVPTVLSEVLGLILEFAEPVMTEAVAGAVWDPRLGAWTQ